MSKLEQIHVSSARVRFETQANFFVRAQLANSRTSSSSTSQRLDKLNRFINNILYLKFDQSIEWLANGTLLLHDAAQSSIYSLNTTLTLCHCQVVLKTLPFAAICRAPELKMGYTRLAKSKAVSSQENRQLLYHFSVEKGLARELPDGSETLIPAMT
jgi:hypothetical protein